MTPKEINALPERVRLYIHALETNADPAGMVQENVLLRDQTKALDAMIARLKSELSCLTDSRDYWMGAESKIQRVAQALEADNAYLKSWGTNQYGNLKERNKVLVAALNGISNLIVDENSLSEAVDIADDAIAAADEEVSGE